MFTKNKTLSLDEMRVLNAIPEIRDSLQIHNNIMIYKELHDLGVVSDEDYKEILRRLLCEEWVL